MSDLAISTITVAEIQQGIEQLRRTEASAKLARLEPWLEGTLRGYNERVLAFDVSAAQEAGRLSDAARSEGKHPGFADVAIAATASVHDLTILTRNLKHFSPLGAPCLDPFEA